MKRATLFCAILIAVLFAVGCNNQKAPTEPTSANLNHALAKATETPVEGLLYVMALEPPSQFWTPGNTRHIRDWTIGVTLTGDLVGTGTFEQHSNWNSDFNGSASGPFTADVTWQGRSGKLTAHFAGNLHEFILSGTIVAQGSEGLEGLKWQATLEGPLNGPYTCSGRILDPKGE